MRLHSGGDQTGCAAFQVVLVPLAGLSVRGIGAGADDWRADARKRFPQTSPSLPRLGGRSGYDDVLEPVLGARCRMT